MSRRVTIPWQREHPYRYSVIEWELDLDRTALMVMDLQAEYVRPGHWLGQRLAETFPKQHAYYFERVEAQVLPNVLRLLSLFRLQGLPVILTRLGTMLPDASDVPPWSWRRANPRLLAQRGSEGYELLAELAPREDELVLDRPTFSPFNSSPIDQVLHNMGVENLVICGVRTELAPESTARNAGERGYSVFLVEDACATFDPAAHADTFGGLSWAVERSTDEVVGLMAA